MARERLQKIIARAGLASRRAAERLIREGHVTVNGQRVDELGAQADPDTDRVEVDGRRVTAQRLAYLVLHKPRACVSTLHDPQGRRTVAQLVASVPARLFPVGRLDYATSGVLLLTNDGELTQALLHPRKKVPKIYVAKLDREITNPALERLRDGVQLDDGPTLPAEVHVMRLAEGKSWLRITLYEGRNQQIRRMAEAVGMRVMRLARISFAGVEGEGLRPGQWRPLSVDEMRALKRSYGVPRHVRAQQLPAGNAPKPRNAGTATGARRPRAGRSDCSGTKRRGAGPPASRGRGGGRRRGC